MKVQCPSCGALYRIDDSKIPAKGAYATCSKCHTRFHTDKQKTPNGEPKQEIITCPKCGHQQSKSAECKNCGIVFSKYYEGEEKKRQETKSMLMKSMDYDRYGFPSYAKYVEYTRTRDWKALCAMSNVNFDSFGTKKELKVLPNYLEDKEVVFALASGIMKQTHTSNWSDLGINTWIVVLTSERFLFLDHALLTRSVDTQSIRHDRVQAVSASQGLIYGKITVDLGARTVVVDNCEKASVSAMASLANKWLAALQKKKDESSTGGGPPGNSPLDEIKKLAELHSMGALTDEEFATAKAKLLASM